MMVFTAPYLYYGKSKLPILDVNFKLTIKPDANLGPIVGFVYAGGTCVSPSTAPF